jgi:hypothetical protein
MLTIFRKPKPTPVEQVTEKVPWIYFQLFVDWLAVYLKRVRVPVITLIGAFSALIVPGILFRNPYTGSPPADIAYINGLGFMFIVAAGYFYFKATESSKNNETAEWNFAHMTLERRGLSFMPYFHFPHGTITKLRRDEWSDVISSIGLEAPELALLKQKSGIIIKKGPDGQDIEVQEGEPEINWFFFPKWPTAEYPLKGIIYGSRANQPSQLYRHMNDIAVYKGYPRKNGNISYYQVGWLGDYPVGSGTVESDIIPVVISTGDHYNYEQIYETITKPIEASARAVLEAKLALGGHLVQDLLIENKTKDDVIAGMKKMELSAQDWGGRLADTLHGINSILTRPTASAQRPAPVSRKLIIGAVVLVVAIAAAFAYFLVRG